MLDELKKRTAAKLNPEPFLPSPSKLDLLQERRTALISAAVTGQMDVRHATA